MAMLSSKMAAKQLGVSVMTLQRYIAAKKVRFPKLQKVGGITVRLWGGWDIERARKDIEQGKRKRKKRKSKV